MKKREFELSPEFQEIINGFQEKFNELSLNVWENLEELKKLQEEIRKSVEETCVSHEAVNNFDRCSGFCEQAEKIRFKILDSIIDECQIKKILSD